MHLWMDKWCSSWKFDACSRTTSETEYQVVRAVSLNLRRIDDDTCVRIEVIESSWHTFLNRSLVRPKGKLLDACFQNFRPAAVYSWHSALVHTKARGRVLLRKVVSRLAQSQHHSSSSGASILSFPLLSCPSKFDVSSSIMCWHDSFAESPTRCNKNSIHSTSMPKVINSGGCSSLVCSNVCDFLVLLSNGSRPHEQHSTIVLHSTTFFLSSMRSSQTVIEPASNCLILIYNALTWSGTLPSKERDLPLHQLPLKIRSLPASLLMFPSTSILSIATKINPHPRFSVYIRMVENTWWPPWSIPRTGPAGTILVAIESIYFVPGSCSLADVTQPLFFSQA